MREIEVRHVEIDGGVLHVYFKVGRYLSYASGSNRTANIYEGKIRDLLGTHVPPSHYITMSAIPAPIQPASGEPSDQAVAWTRVVDQLLQVEVFKASLFYRVIGLSQLFPQQEEPSVVDTLWRMFRPIGREPMEVAVSEVLPLQSGYRLQSGGNYGLNLSFYRRAGTEAAVQKAILTPSLDETHFAYNPGPIQVRFRYDKHELNLISKTVTEDTLTMIQLRLDETNEIERDKAKERPEGVVTAPQPTFLLQLKAPGRQILGFALFLAGSILTGLASVFESPGKEIAAVLGASTTTVVLFWLYRRLK